ncbi:hypothetical protein HELRODRAFT_75060 [Helobdella robusta]|uniref:Transmembrane protein 14C n=1 Tax=Helobdella robusta TaxID=6412 RepID=T1G200_HELRO|nr:hypothetical protein HELRODRAFT_75060 [Helobdella robusta]ESO08518.1 hypothetical protein HELRODRAFT_75060 [Helobdella robusta]
MDFISFGYALVIAAGGIYGYVKAGSVASLVSGLLFGGLSACGALMTSNNPANCTLLFGTCLALGSLMSYRTFKSGKFMPAGVVASLRLAEFLYGPRSAYLNFYSLARDSLANCSINKCFK